MNTKTKVIVNPKAGGGLVLKKWDTLKIILEKHLQSPAIQFTQKPNEAAKITKHALKEGFETIVAVGGDGTINEVINGFFEKTKPINADAKLGIIPMGTGKDFVRTLNFPPDFQTAISKISDGRFKQINVGKVQYLNFEDKNTERYFINIADAGFGGAVVATVSNSKKIFNHFFTYILGLLRTLIVYKNKSIHITIDGSSSFRKTVSAVVVANGQYFGGGMWVAPDAKPDDDLFEIVIVGDVTRGDIFRNINKLYNGKIATYKKVTILQGKKVILDSEEEVPIDCDGELIGKLPATFRMLDEQIRVIC